MTQAQQDTPSPLVNHLLACLRSVHDGRRPPEFLVELAAEQHQALLEARQETEARLAAQGQHHLLRYEPYIQALLASFDDLAEALDGLVDYARTGQGFAVVEELLERAAFSSKSAMDHYQQSELETGPHQIPLLNVIHELAEVLEESEEAEEALLEVVEGASRMVKAALAELESASGVQPKEARGLIRAYREQHRQLLEVGQAAAAGGPRLEQAMTALTAASEGVREAMLALSLAQMRGGPCRLERTNILLAATGVFLDGGLSEEGYSATLESFFDELEGEQKELERLALLNRNPDVDEVLERVRDAYAQHGEALVLLQALLNDEDTYEQAREILIEASESLSDCKSVLDKIAQSEGRVTCVRCSASNEPASRVCGSCGAQLPQQHQVESTMDLAERADESRLELTENLERLFRAVNAVVDGEISPEDFDDVLLWMDERAAQALAELPVAPSLDPGRADSPEAREKRAVLQEELNSEREGMVMGLLEFREALGDLQAFLEDEDTETLAGGVTRVSEAALKVQAAQRRIESLSATAGNSAETEKGGPE